MKTGPKPKPLIDRFMAKVAFSTVFGRKKYLTTSRSKTLVINAEHVCEALTQYLHALAMLDKNMEVTSFKKSPEGLEIKVAD